MIKKEFLAHYPIRFLDDKLHGILTGDFVMVAAATSDGKSTISRKIAFSAVKQDQPVVLYSLEDEKGTFDSDVIFCNYAKKNVNHMDFREWLVDNTKNPDKYKKEKQDAMRDLLKVNERTGLESLVVHELKSPNWTLDEVIKSIKSEIERGYKLFILDHLDCLITSERPDDMVRAINALWQLVAEKQIALITYSQLATNRNKQSLCPSLDDLRGSKSKVHVPTIVVSIAKHRYNYYPQFEGKPTYIRILKNRQHGEQVCSVSFFDKGNYTNEYMIVPCNESGTMIDGMTLDKFQKIMSKEQGFNEVVSDSQQPVRFTEPVKQIERNPLDDVDMEALK